MKLTTNIKYIQIIKRFYPGGEGPGKEIVKKVIGAVGANKPINIIPPAQNNNHPAQNNNNQIQHQNNQTENNNQQVNIKKHSFLEKPSLVFPELSKKPNSETNTETENKIDFQAKINNDIENTLKKVCADDIAKLGLSLEDIKKKLTEIGFNNPEDYNEKMDAWIDKNVFKKFNENLVTTLKYFPFKNTTSETDIENNLNNNLSKEFIQVVSEINDLEKFLKQDPKNLDEFVGEITYAYDKLKEKIKNFCEKYDNQLNTLINYQNNEEYKKIYPDGLDMLYSGQICTYDAIMGSFVENLSTKDQLEKNMETLNNIKKSMLYDEFLSPKQLLEISKKLGLVEYRDVSFHGKPGDLYELIEHKQKQSGQTVLNIPVENNKQFKKDLPNLKMAEIIEILTTKKFYALDINIKNSKFDELFIPSGITAHTCIAIDYEDNLLILAYLTSTKDSPKIFNSQLYDKTKSQYLYVLNNLCIEEKENIILNEKIQKYLEDPEILENIIRIFSNSCTFKEAMKNPMINMPIITIQDLKNKVIEKADLMLLHFEKKLKIYENCSEKIKEKDEKKKLHYILENLNLKLNDEVTKILIWYLDMEKRIKVLEKKEKYDSQNMYKKNNNIENISENNSKKNNE